MADLYGINKNDKGKNFFLDEGDFHSLKKKKASRLLQGGIVLGLFFFLILGETSCTTQPSPAVSLENPLQGSFTLKSAEAMTSGEALLIAGVFEVSNTTSQEIFVTESTVEITVEDRNHRVSTITVPLSPSGQRQTLKAGASSLYPFSASVKIRNLTPDEGGNFLCHLTGRGLWESGKNSLSHPFKVSQAYSVKWLRAPELRILSLAVKQAELVNTRFRIRLSVYNPNGFPLTISRMRYELFGNGRPWADGFMEKIYTVPSAQTTEVDVFVVMNFIDMGRDLFNQVLTMKDVSYRFAGTLQLATPLESQPPFSYAFNLEGFAPVER